LRSTADAKSRIGLAGEYRVLSELLKKGYDASLTMGNAKATDILVFDGRRSHIRVEVKTSRNGRNFVTGYYPKYSEPSSLHPDIWILYLPEPAGRSDGDRFFIMTHEEAGRIQLEVNGGTKTEKGRGCDNIPLHKIKDRVDLIEQWGKIGAALDNLQQHP
jgi:hypothetical protein